MTSRVRIRAPELSGRRWLNTGGDKLTLSQLRGRIVLLDFWTSCCVNCLHVLDELRPLEEKYSDVLVVIGIHSPKFDHEAEPAVLASAVARYDVRHPVLDDGDLATWRQYAVRAWPTLVVIDPAGYISAQLSGEGHAHAIDTIVSEIVSTHSAKGTLRRGDGPFVPVDTVPSTLRFPAKVIRLQSGNWLLADAGHHSLVELAPDGETLVRRIGSGQRGFTNGPALLARFNEPNGLCLVPPDLADGWGFDVVVADTTNHALRGVRLDDGNVTTLARRALVEGNDAVGSDHISSPWDVEWFPAWGSFAVAMAGSHQIWSYDPATSTAWVAAGTTNEGLVDGELSRAWFAQPSALATSSDGQTLWLVDAETSSLRRIRNGVVHTEVGTGLFDFGHVDGPASTALMQHPLGIGVLPDDSVLVADTYNGALRRFDPISQQLTTVATGLAEPIGVVVAASDVVVTESNAHRLTRVLLPETAVEVAGARLHSERPVMDVVAGSFEVSVTFDPPAGQKLDERYGPATHLVVSASPTQLIVEGAGTGDSLARTVLLSGDVPDGVLHVSARVASCDDDRAQFPACHVHQQDWGVPVSLAESGAAKLELVLAARQ